MGILEELSKYDPNYEYGTLLPFRKHKQNRTTEFAAPAIVKDLLRAFTAPGRAFEGTLDVNSPDGMMEAANFVTNLQLGGLGSAAATKTGGRGTLGSVALLKNEKLSDAKTLAEKMYPKVSQDGELLSYPLSSGRLHRFKKPPMLSDIVRDKLAREYSSLGADRRFSRTFNEILGELPPGYENLAYLRMRTMTPEQKVNNNGMYYPHNDAIGFKNLSDILDPKQTVLEHELTHATLYRLQPGETAVYDTHPEIPKALKSLADMDGGDLYTRLRKMGMGPEVSPLNKLVMEMSMDRFRNPRRNWSRRPEEMVADWGAGRSNDYLQRHFNPSINSGPLLNKLTNLTTEEDILKAMVVESQGGQTLYDTSLKSLLSGKN